VNIVAWNIQGGGGRRVGAIADELIRRDADVFVIGEYVRGKSEPLVERLADEGWVHAELPEPPDRYGGVAVISRHVLKRLDPLSGMGEQADYRHVGVGIAGTGMEIRAVYGPLHKDPYRLFWESLLGDLSEQADRPTLVIGDFNAGMPRTDNEASTFFCSRYFEQFPGIGYTDLWRRSNGADAREHTWECRRDGTVFPHRLDHAFGSPTVTSRLRACHYDHAVRRAKLSDHSLLTVELDDAATAHSSGGAGE